MQLIQLRFGGAEAMLTICRAHRTGRSSYSYIRRSTLAPDSRYLKLNILIFDRKPVRILARKLVFLDDSFRHFPVIINKLLRSTLC
jgi:hypothetical protein